MPAPAVSPGQVRPPGVHRYRIGMSKAAQDALRRPLWHAVEPGPDLWGHAGRLDYGRLETLLERFQESEVDGRSAVMLDRREASTLLAWIQLQVRGWDERGADYPGSVSAVVPRLEYMLGLRREIPGRERGAPELTQRFPEE